MNSYLKRRQQSLFQYFFHFKYRRMKGGNNTDINLFFLLIKPLFYSIIIKKNKTKQKEKTKEKKRKNNK